MRRIRISLFLFLSIVAVLGSAQVSASNGPPVLGPAYTPTPPSINGVIDPDEWSLADWMDFTVGSHSGRMYVMNDAGNLYIALRLQDDDASDNDEMKIFFDNDNGGGALQLGDDVIWHTTVQFRDGYHEPPLATDYDEDDGGSTDGSGDRTRDGSNVWYVEFSHPLNTADDSHDFSLSYGDTVGFDLAWDDAPVPAGPKDYLYWPSSDWTNAETFGDIIIAEPPKPVGGEIIMTKWLTLYVPCFASLLVLFVAILHRDRDNHR